MGQNDLPKHNNYYFLSSYKCYHPKDYNLSSLPWKRNESRCSDQRQISPSNINAYSTPEVMRIKDMIT